METLEYLILQNLQDPSQKKRYVLVTRIQSLSLIYAVEHLCAQLHMLYEEWHAYH